MPILTANTGRRVTTLASRIALNWPRGFGGDVPETLRADLDRSSDVLVAAREDDRISWEDAVFVALVLARHRGAIEGDKRWDSMEMDAFDLIGAAITRA